MENNKLNWKKLIVESFGVAVCIATAALIFYLWDYDHKIAEEIDTIEQSIPTVPVIEPSLIATSTSE